MTKMLIGGIPFTDETNRAYARSFGMPDDFMWLDPYPGSVESRCTACNGRMWLGPKQQEAIASLGPRVTVMCLLCAMVALEAEGYTADDVPLISLGERNTSVTCPTCHLTLQPGAFKTPICPRCSRA